MQSQSRNLFFFFICFMAIMIFYPMLRNKLYPPAPSEKVRNALGQVCSLVTAEPFGDSLKTIAYVSQAAPFKTEPKVETWAYKDWAAKDQAVILARVLAAPTTSSFADAAGVLGQFVVNQRVIERHARAAKPAEEYCLGGEGFHITATLTAEGAGIRELILNHFDEGDKDGLKVIGANGKLKLLTLIPRNERLPPAFAMFHYAKADEDEPRPLDTLGTVH